MLYCLLGSRISYIVGEIAVYCNTVLTPVPVYLCSYMVLILGFFLCLENKVIFVEIDYFLVGGCRLVCNLWR